MRRFISGVFAVALCLSPFAAGAQPDVASTASRVTYPPAPRGGVIDDYFGTKVPDPYRWLENIDAPETLNWVQAEQHLTRAYLDAIPQRNAIAAHLKKIANYERISVPWHMKNRYFYTHNSGLQNQAVLYTMEGAHGTPRVLIDPNRLSNDGTVALGSNSVSWNARYIAYSTQSAGSDWETWHVRNIATGKDLADALLWCKFSGAAWSPDNAGFYYERFPVPKTGDTYKGALTNEAIYYHKLGTAQSADRFVYSLPAEPKVLFFTSVTADGRYAVITISSNTTINNRISYIDLREPGHPVHKLFDKNDAQYNYVDNAGTRFLFTTTLDAPNTRIVAVDLTHPKSMTTVIPESVYALTDTETAGRRIFASYLVDAHSAVKEYDYAGHFVRDVTLPGPGTADGFGGWPNDKTVYYSFSSYATPPVTYTYNIVNGASTLYKKPRIAFDASQYETKEVFYTSKDGTKVPLWISGRKGLVLDGSHPALLYAYGGFDIPITPRFSSFIVTWMQMGGIYAVANIRGGSEYGERWHHGGMLVNKQHVFDDFIAAAHYLIDRKYTSTPKLAINGASNGGLLMGAVETQQPSLFGAVVAQVGVMDMLRFDKFTIGSSWISEYGCSTCSEEQFQTLYAYSPYQNVKPGTVYPPTLVMTADHDDRVFPAHSFKFAVAMQAAQAGDAPILLRIESKAGHGGGTPISKSIEEYTDVYAFLVKSLGMQLPADFR